MVAAALAGSTQAIENRRIAALYVRLPLPQFAAAWLAFDGVLDAMDSYYCSVVTR
jgi:hypothetical protein